MIYAHFLFFFLFAKALALYSSKSPVKIIDSTVFKAKKSGGKPFLIEFFSSGCGHCKNFVPEYEKTGKALSGIVEVVATEDRNVMSDESISGFPTVKFISGSRSTVYKGARTAEAIIDFVMKELEALAKARIGSKKDTEEKSSKTSNVIVLNDSNFKDHVIQKEKIDVWLLEFYAPWCGHCKALAPTWEEVATELKGKVKVAKIDATTENLLAQHFGIQGFPTIVLLPRMARSFNSLPSDAVKYEDGARNKDSIVEFAMGYAKKDLKPMQLLTQDQFDEECKKGVCMISFLPHIIESKTEKRLEYLKILEAVVQSTSSPVKFFWSEGGAQYKWEEQLHLQFGWPAVIAVNLDKGKFAVHKGTYTEKALRTFITGLMSGNIAVDNLPNNLVKLNEVLPWDGKDMLEEEL